MDILNYFLSIMEDSDGYPSSKRYAVLIFVLMFIVAFVSEVYFGHPVKQYYIDCIMYVIIAGLGITGAEKFAKTKTNTFNDQEDGGV